MTTIFIDKSVEVFNVPLDKLRAQHPGKRLVVGVAIVASADCGVKHSFQQIGKKLLILQRAETEQVHPLMYEIPGGGAELEDATILDTVVRETAEETGLSASKILDTFPGFEYETPKSKSIQFNFLVEIGGKPGTVPIVRLNPEEHCAFVWIDQADDLSCYPMTEEMHRVVCDALSAMGSMN